MSKKAKPFLFGISLFFNENLFPKAIVGNYVDLLLAFDFEKGIFSMTTSRRRSTLYEIIILEKKKKKE